MTKKFHFAVMLLLIAALPLQIFATEKNHPNAIEASTAPIDCPTATISYKNQSFCNSDNTLQAVDLQGTGSYTGGTFSTTPGLNINTQTGTITPNSSTTGIYTVTYTIPASGNCPATTATTSVTINPILTPTVNCGISTTTSVQFTWKAVAGATGYSISYQVNAGQVVNIGAIVNVLTYSVSGLIAGDVVTMTVTPTGDTCYNSGTLTCTADNCIPTTAFISYTGTPFCKSVTTAQTVTLTGTGYYTGGTFTASPSGLSINATTGAITPSTSTAGTYTVTYVSNAIPGCSSITATTTVVITAIPTAAISYATPFCKSVATAQEVSLTGATGGTYSASPAGLTINTSTGAITPNTSTVGTYTVTYTIPTSGYCTGTTATTTVVVTTTPTAAISYATPFCKSITTAQVVTLTGTNGGVYSATPAGLTINAATGAITPSTSTAGTYTVTYTIPALGDCTATSATTTVVITAVPTATISYATPFCKSVTTTQAVILTGTSAYTGGSYTASPSGLIINASTGAITPSNSIAGTYTVTYTIPASGGCPQVTATTTVVITAVPTAIISYVGTPFCKSLTTAQAVTINGIGAYSGGPYTISPSGLSINFVTGAITPSKSTAGTYTVTYTIPASAGCRSDTATTTVEIKDDTSLLNISTNKTEICENGAVTYSVTENNPLPNTVYSWDLNGKYMGDGNSKVINIKENDIVTCSSSKKCVNTTAPTVKIIKKTNTPISIVDASTANNTYVVSGVCDACSGDATYKWSKGNQTVSNTKEYNYNNLNNGDIVKLTVTDVTNCLLGETTMIVTIKRNTISGKVLYNTGIDDCATGVPYQNKAVIAKQNSYTYTGYTNKTGDYEINVPEGNYTLDVYKEVNYPTTITPQNVAVVVQGTSNNYINNFCLSNTSNENDIAVSMYPLNSARPGFEAKYVLYLRNKGYSFVSGNYTLKYDPTKMNFTSATPTIASNTNGILTWDYSNLAPGAAIEINLVMTIITPPTVNSGTVLNYVLTGNLTLTDKNPQDNEFNYNQTVVNSYDPNDKIVVEGAYINESQATDHLHYITRFQNTGTASAINVVVKETLDNNLDWSTFEPEGSSHTGNIELKLGDQLSATFLNINLEDSTTNEPASHGWIAYKIKPKPGFAIGDVAFAKSDIYFDFNAPIITNTVSTQIQLLSNPDFENSTIQLYPNPVTDNFSINTNEEISNITVFDLNGRAVCATKNQNNINIAALTTGLYIVEVKTVNGIFRKKLIKN